MNTRKVLDTANKRMLPVEEAAAYIGMGFSKTKSILSEIGAKRNLGRRVVYDKVVIDKWLDALTTGEEGDQS